MTVPRDLFPAHRDAVRCRIEIQEGFGESLGQLPTRAAEATARKAAWQSSLENEARILDAARLAAESGKVIPRPRRGR